MSDVASLSVGITIAPELPGVFFCLHCLFSFCCLLSSAYCLSRSPAAFFVIHSHSTETFLFYYYYYIYTATYSRQHLRRCHPIECDTELTLYLAVSAPLDIRLAHSGLMSHLMNNQSNVGQEITSSIKYI